MSEKLKCGLPANFLVHWPGREALAMCDKHATKAVGVSQAMGFHLSTTPTDAGDCTQIIAEQEKPE